VLDPTPSTQGAGYQRHPTPGVLRYTHLGVHTSPRGCVGWVVGKHKSLPRSCFASTPVSPKGPRRPRSFLRSNPSRTVASGGCRPTRSTGERGRASGSITTAKGGGGSGVRSQAWSTARRPGSSVSQTAVWMAPCGSIGTGGTCIETQTLG